MHIIGINGLKTSGKDTTFGLIEKFYDETGGVARRVAFADKLKIMAMLALGFDAPDDELVRLADVMKNGAAVSVLHEGLAGSHSLTGRSYLQNFGNHARRVFGDTFWIDQVLPSCMAYEEQQHALKTMYPGVDLLVVTDVRYPNEAGRVLDLFGDVWEVVRPGIESDGHASETPLDRSLIDFTLVNDGTIEDLGSTVRGLLI